MAAVVGRLTGRPGVCIATSGPGASNLTTGLATATTEGDPVLAIVGIVPRAQSHRHTHQSLSIPNLLSSVCKSVLNVDVEDQVSEIVLRSIRTASQFPQGATCFAIPMDVAQSTTKVPAFDTKAFSAPKYGIAPASSLEAANKLVKEAKFPVLFLGMRAGSPEVVRSVRGFLKRCPLPVVETFQAAGAISKDLVHLFAGRVGLFRNQPGDKLLATADVIVCVGFDAYEYDANVWNSNSSDATLIHIDYHEADYGVHYSPEVELLGSIESNLDLLSPSDKIYSRPEVTAVCLALREELSAWKATAKSQSQPGGLVHPLHFIALLQESLSEDTLVTVDIGTVYIWMMRFFYAYQPRRLLSSNGQQTLGVGLPWAIGASLIQDPPCSQKVVSLSGDGGFMFSSQELSTAVLQKCNITHFIWNDGHYNMVEFQEVMKYGRSSGIALGGVDFAKFAEAFGAKGFRVEKAEELEEVMAEALAYNGVSIVDIKIDYSHNLELAQDIIPEDYR
ncbi:Acetohydroxy-acid synthase [Hyphodiscus hymeniophilus]|uniref:Acetohydroxy-acid synthase n=1 Tax=Hyphodiscus hymeniophilus TaxID=353542 RepID=A0A9P6VNP3_9HELO|nr:Acetohydroxy-acid synthase [Hyphodiscus hymeniophilus]